MKKLIFLLQCMFFIFCIKPLSAATKIDIVTYADFSHIRDIAASMNNVYFATTEGVIKYDKFSEKWQKPLNGSPGIDYRNIYKLYVDQFDQKLYARTEINAYEYDMMFESWFYINEIPTIDNPAREILPSKIMYVPTGYIYTGDGYIQDALGIQYQINRMIDDGSGTKWLSIWGLGAAKASSSDIIEFLPYGLIQNRVNTIFYSDGTLIVGGDNVGSARTGITFFDYNDNSFSYKESGLSFDFPDENIKCIEEDSDFYYIGTSGGLTILDKENLDVVKNITERNGLVDDRLLSLKMIKDKLYIGTINGLQVYSEKTDSLKLVYSSQFKNQEIYDLELVDSTLWIASAVGAFQLHLNTHKLKKFVDPHKIAFSRIYNIEHKGENLFIASSNGMVRLNLKTGETTPYISDSHGTNYRALAVNDSVAFISTDFGFTMFYLDADGYSNEREFTTTDGLPSQFVFDLLIDGDYLWVGSDRGLSLFLWNDPDRID